MENIKNQKKINISEYNDLIETIAKVEAKKLSSNCLIDYSELVNIGTHVVYNLVMAMTATNQYNHSYIATAIKWAIRNEVRRRYKWYSLKSKKENNGAISDEDHLNLREAVYKTILSIDELQSADVPTQIPADEKTPEEKLAFHELSEAIKEAIKHLPPRERELIEYKFFKDKKLREISEDFELSPSRISRIIQSGLDKIKTELCKQGLV